MYQKVKRDREEYRDMEIDVDSIYKINVINRVYPKECYAKSWDYIVYSSYPENLVLVHGTCTIMGGLKIGHGWVEIGENILFEGVYQRFYDKEKYYAARGLVKHFEYTIEELRELSYKFKHKGPWEREIGCFYF
jgi:hypothetical protein